MKMVAYVRASRERVEGEYGIEVQNIAIRSWCERNGHELVTVLCDNGVSGKTEATLRRGLSLALNLIQASEADGLVVLRLDRLARSLTTQEAALAHVWQHGGRVFTVDDGEVMRDDPNDPMRTAMRQMTGVFAQLERSMILARMRAGRRAKFARGGYAGGYRRFGVEVVDGDYVSSTAEQMVIARAIQLRSCGMTLRQIADTLTAEDYVPPRGGERWYASTVRNILRRERAA
jgi:DNA invertase Pin-like site-specific DNA recombinase